MRSPVRDATTPKKQPIVKEVIRYLEYEPLHESCCVEIEFIYELLKAMDDTGTPKEKWENFWKVAKLRGFLYAAKSAYNPELNIPGRKLTDIMYNVMNYVRLSREYRKWKQDRIEEGKSPHYQDFKVDPAIARQIEEYDRQARRRADLYGVSKYEEDHIVETPGERE